MNHEAPPKPSNGLRIVSWNCAGALHRKLDHLLALEPDIAIVPEACQPERLRLPDGATFDWVGRLPFKGLGVFSFGDWRIERLMPHEPRLEWILPVVVTGELSFTLMAVWAMNHRAHQKRVEGWPLQQPLAAADAYALDAHRLPIIVAGDFNGATTWDTPRRPAFAQLIGRYGEIGLTSAYHHVSGDQFGLERQPTHWWRDRKETGPTYHIDYAFIPNAWLDAAALTIGGFNPWVTNAGSDHAPLILDLDLDKITVLQSL
jgi:hypothetical protein